MVGGAVAAADLEAGVNGANGVHSSGSGSDDGGQGALCAAMAGTNRATKGGLRASLSKAFLSTGMPVTFKARAASRQGLGCAAAAMGAAAPLRARCPRAPAAAAAAAAHSVAKPSLLCPKQTRRT